MKMQYDDRIDALYLCLDESEVARSEEVRPGVILDFNASGELIGIDMLDVKRRVPSSNPREMEFEVASKAG